MKHLNRRSAAALTALALLAASCGGDDDSGAGSPDAAEATAPAAPAEASESPGTTEASVSTGPAAVSDRCGDPARLGDSLNFYNWADYIDPAVLTDFESECGVTVTMDTYTSNEEMMAKVQAGNSGYSLVIPTDYAAEIMIESGLAQPLDMTAIPNAANLDPQQMGQYYDPANEFTLPYQYSTTGLAYNATAFDEPPTSWSALFDENQHCNQSSILDDQYEAVGAALVYLGHEWSSGDPAAHEAAADLLISARDCVSAFDSANFIGNLASGEVVLAESWGFAAGIARIDNPDVRFVIPDEGGILWQDNFLIPADAPDPYTAHVLINYMLFADVGAKITEFTLAFTPNPAAAALLSDDYHSIIDDGGIAITDDVRSRLTPSVHGDEELFGATWNAVVTAS